MESYDENLTPPGGGRMAVAPPAALSTEVPTPPGTEMPPDLRTIVAAETERESPRTPAADAGSTDTSSGSVDSGPADSGARQAGGADTHTDIPGTDGAAGTEEPPD